MLFLRYGMDRCNRYFPFWATFYPFTLPPPPPNRPKNQNFEKMKKWGTRLVNVIKHLPHEIF